MELGSKLKITSCVEFNSGTITRHRRKFIFFSNGSTFGFVVYFHVSTARDVLCMKKNILKVPLNFDSESAVMQQHTAFSVFQIIKRLVIYQNIPNFLSYRPSNQYFPRKFSH